MTPATHRCLDKDRERRLPDIGVARLEIDDARVSDAIAPVPATAHRAAVPWLVAPLAIAALLAVGWLVASPLWNTPERQPVGSLAG